MDRQTQPVPHTDSREDIDPDTPEVFTDKELAVTLYEDASYASDLDTRKSVTSYDIVVGRTITKTYSKRQNTVEGSTYGAELVASRVAIEAALATRYKLRMLGMKVTKPVVILCDNMSVVHNMQLPSSALKKKHNAVAWAKCREAVAIGAVKFAHIGSKWNLADLGTKAKGPEDYYRLLREPLFGKPNTKPAPDSRGVVEDDSVPGHGRSPFGSPGENKKE